MLGKKMRRLLRLDTCVTQSSKMLNRRFQIEIADRTAIVVVLGCYNGAPIIFIGNAEWRSIIFPTNVYDNKKHMSLSARWHMTVLLKHINCHYCAHWVLPVVWEAKHYTLRANRWLKQCIVHNVFPAHYFAKLRAKIQHWTSSMIHANHIFF